MNSETNQKTRLRFFAKRLFLSVILFAAFALVVRLIWFPDALFQIGGIPRKLQILASVIFVLGPGLSTLLYAPEKPKLMMDMGILLTLEIALIGVAAASIFAERPVFVVFAVDRFEVIRSEELDRQRLGYDELKSPQGAGPQFAIARLPVDIVERSDLVSAVVLEGAPDIDRRPSLWHPYSTGIDEVINRGRPVDLLEPYDLDGQLGDLYADSELQSEDLLFLPVRGRDRDGALIVLRADARPMAIVDIDPWLDLP